MSAPATIESKPRDLTCPVRRLYQSPIHIKQFVVIRVVYNTRQYPAQVFLGSYTVERPLITAW